MDSLISLAAALCLLTTPAASDDLASLVDEVRVERDQVDVDTVLAIGDVKSREAAEALIEVYDLFQTAYMRRHALRALAKLDGVADAEQLALQKLLDVAVGSSRAPLREAAVDSLARCRHLGKAFLAMVVESVAEDDIRVRAMTQHIAGARREDMGWYRELWSAAPVSQKEINEARDRIQEEGYEPEPWPLEEVRWLAFQAVVGELDDQELRSASGDRDVRVRTRVLYAMEERAFKDTVGRAEKALNSFGPPSWTRLRIAGAEILLRLEGADVADELIDHGKRVDTPDALRDRMADLLAELGDEDVDGDLRKLVAKGKIGQKLFALRAVRDMPDEKGKLDKAIRKGLKDREFAVRIATIETIAHRADEGSLKDLEKLYEKTKDEVERAACLDALVVLRRGDADFVAELVAQTRSEDDELRNAAVRNLGLLGDDDHHGVLRDALYHRDWNTRYQALRALERLRSRDSVSAIIESMDDEVGRLELEFGEALFRMTGQLFGRNQPGWAAWWEDARAEFEFPSTLDLRRAEREQENLALKETSSTQFFGIEIRSHRVTFVIDVSGSMEERIRGRYVGEEGATRFEVAKGELDSALGALDKRSLFNLVTFSDRALAWAEAIREVNDEALTEVREHVAELRAGGATNLYGALELAFEDRDVDTIFVLSDGEPTVPPTDPVRIVNSVNAWNRNRGVTIHAVAVGGQLQILRQLADGTGGQYVEYR